MPRLPLHDVPEITELGAEGGLCSMLMQELYAVTTLLHNVTKGGPSVRGSPRFLFPVKSIHSGGCLPASGPTKLFTRDQINLNPSRTCNVGSSEPLSPLTVVSPQSVLFGFKCNTALGKFPSSLTGLTYLGLGKTVLLVGNHNVQWRTIFPLPF